MKPVTEKSPATWLRWDEGIWVTQAHEDSISTRAAATSVVASHAQGPAGRARQFRPLRGVRHLPMGEPGKDGADLLAWFSPDGRTTYSRSLTQLSRHDLVNSFPTRDFSRRNSQSHKPVAVWTHTTNAHVHCESRLEREFVLLADFDKRVEHIAAQPFTLVFPAGWALKKHTVDFVILSPGQPPIAVDVKTPKAAADPENVERHALIRAVLAEAGIHHLVWTGLPFDVMNNLALFSKATPEDEVLLDLVPALLLLARPGMTGAALASATAAEFGLDRGTALYVIKRLLWLGAMSTDMTVPYRPDSAVTFR